MPRTAVPKITPPTQVAATTGLTVTPTAADIANFNQFALTGGELLLVLNTAGATGTVTVTSVPDSSGRSQTITADVIPAAVGGLPGMKLYPRFGREGWQQSDGNLYFQGSAVTLFFLVLQVA